MPIPSLITIELYLLHEIEEMGGVIDVARQKKELVARLRRYFPDMTDSEAIEPTPKMRYPRFQNHVEWARNRLVNVRHYLDGSVRGRWGPITPQGHAYLAREWPPKERTGASDGSVRIESPARPKEDRTRIQTETIPASPLADRLGGTTVEEFLQAVRDDTALRSRLRARLAQLADYDFEFLIKRYLEVVEGMTGVEVTPQSRDRGIDLYGDRPATPYKRRVAVQAKKWLGATVGSREIQQFEAPFRVSFLKEFLLRYQSSPQMRLMKLPSQVGFL